MVKIVNLGIAAGMIAPYYNLVFVVLVVILFMKLFREHHTNRTFMLPWELLFAIICVYIFEEILTILRMAGVISIPIHINGFFELAIAILGVYLIFVQKAHIKKNYGAAAPAQALTHKAKKG